MAAAAVMSIDDTSAKIMEHQPSNVAPVGTSATGPVDVRIAMVGNVDSGKSTLVGCLARACLDDGRGMARSFVFRHRHEQENGRTTSVAVELLGFKGDAQVVADPKATRRDAWRNIESRADHSVTLIDLCGHEKYLKTTVFGLTGLIPDYALVVVGANMGVSKMTREHIGIVSALHIPIMVVVTKIDIAPPDVYKNTMNQVGRCLKAARKMPYMVKTADDVETAATAIAADRIAPVFCISSVSGENMDLLRDMVRKLVPRAAQAAAEAVDSKAEESKATSATGTATAGASTAGSDGTAADADADGAKADSAKADAKADANGSLTIDSVFQVPGVGTVVAGVMTRGAIHAGQTVWLGPDSSGAFQPVVVRSIHVHFTEVPQTVIGKSAALAIRPKKARQGDKRPWIRRGMRLVCGNTLPVPVRTFTASIQVLHHQTTMARGYSPNVHCGVVSQCATVVSIKSPDGADCESLRTGDRAIVTFRFMYRPELIEKGAMLLFREGTAKGVGVVMSTDEPEPPAS